LINSAHFHEKRKSQPFKEGQKENRNKEGRKEDIGGYLSCQLYSREGCIAKILWRK
jgi:hypothetical protein